MTGISTTNGEDFILGSSGIGQSRWRTYHVQKGMIPNLASETPSLQKLFINALPYHLRNQYNATYSPDQTAIEFVAGVHIPAPLRIENPGKLNAKPGDPLLIEALEYNAFEAEWQRQTDVDVPFVVRARAQIRMQTTGTKRATVWAVTGFGQVDEFHSVLYDENLANRLIASTKQMLQRLEEDNPPEIEEDDLNAALDLASNRTGKTVEADEQHPVTILTAQYKTALEIQKNADHVAKKAKEDTKGIEKQILRLLNDHPAYKIPTGELVYFTMIRKSGGITKPSAYPRLDIKTAK